MQETKYSSIVLFLIAALLLLYGCESHRNLATDTDDSDIKLMDPIESQPLYPGGTVAMFRFIEDNYRFPVELSESGPHGMTVIQCVIEVDGSISNIEVIRSVDPLLDKEALRVVKLMLKFVKPAYVQGKAVRCKFAIPFKSY